MERRFLMAFAIVCMVLLAAGCIAPPPSAPFQEPGPSRENLTPAAVVEASGVPGTPTVMGTTQLLNTIPVQNQNTPALAESPQKGEPDPFINSLQIRNNFFSFTIPGCDMKEIFPLVAKDLLYGIEQPVPKLSSLSAAEMHDFTRDYTEGSFENSQLKGIYGCEGVVMPPDWNFAEVRAVITPRNTRPALYEITLNIQSRGRNLTVFYTRENLTRDQPVILKRYVPVKTDETGLVDAASIAFKLLPEPVTPAQLPTTAAKPEIVDPNLLVFRTFSNQYYTIRYPEHWTVEETPHSLSTGLKSAGGRITYTLTAIPRTTDVWIQKTDRETYLDDVSGDYPGFLPENIMRDFGHCSAGDARSCMQYSVYLPDGRYSKKVFVATLNLAHEFRIQCPDDRCKNLGEYMTNSITVKDTRSN